MYNISKQAHNVHVTEVRDMSAGEKIRELRGARTQSEVAAAVGITKSALAMYERDERRPRDEVKVKLANFFGRTVAEIFYPGC